ncbi:thrombomodulin-like [Pseudophryne corroboree]|uniref:thrombomodulin-like n=1 Tax=Pseudophryne corroboree TaxID=495146 RepID=UPI003081A331
MMLLLLLHTVCAALLSAHLAHLAPLDELALEFVCLDQACYSVSWMNKRFAKASKSCSDIQGHLMTVKNSVQADAIALLMGKVEKADARVWIGLEQPYKNRCTDTLQPLRGFTWVTGGSYTDYSNWKSGEQKCGALCATVRKDATWEEIDCDSKADGYLCEISYFSSCNALTVPADYNVTYYHTSLGFGLSGGPVFPPGTNAVISTFQDTLFCLDKGESGGVWSSNAPAAWTCLIMNGGCDHECVEVSGTPECQCPPGSQLKADKRACSTPCDPNPCSQLCVSHSESPGFFCMCSEGYNLADDGTTCEDIDDCAVNPNICESHCTNTIGSFVCSCKPGFEMVDECEDRGECQAECQDIDECINPATLCEHDCENYPGGYRCVCVEGFVIDEKKPNKCKRFCNTSFCEAECDVNNKDKCQCPDGYIVDENDAGDPICTDVDECDSVSCDWSCTNLFGSYQCICPEGYTVQHTKCIPPEEGSGGTETPSEITPSPSTTPDIPSLQPAMLLGICIGIISMLTVLIAILCHMLRKQSMEQQALDYKCKNTEKDVVLQQVKSEPQRTL